MRRYTLSELEVMPTIDQGHFDNLKIQTPTHRVWLSRCGVADGMPHDHGVTVEQLQAGRWVKIDEYSAATPGEYQPKTGARCHCRKGVQRDNCPDCEGTGWRIDFAAIRARRLA